MIMVQSTYHLLPEHRRDALRLMQKMSRAARSRPGCVKFDCLLGLNSPDAVILLQEWEDARRLESYLASEQFSDFFSQISDKIELPIASRTYVTALSVGEAEPVSADARFDASAARELEDCSEPAGEAQKVEPETVH